MTIERRGGPTEFPSALARFLPEQLGQQGADRQRQARLSILFATLIGGSGAIAAIFHFFRGSPVVGWAFALAASIAWSAPFVLRRSGSIARAGMITTAAWFFGTIASVITRGGIDAPALVPMTFAPLFATMLVSRRAGVIWSLACALVVLGLLTFRWAGVPLEDPVPPESRPLLHAVMGGLFIAFSLGLGFAYESLKNAALEQVRRSTGEIHALEMARMRAESDAALARAERLVSIGRLAAGTAHEINNPLSYLIGNLEVLREQLSAQPATRESAELILAASEAHAGAMRIRSVVRDLKSFSREQEEVSSTDVRTVLDSTIRMVANEARHRAQVVTAYEGVPAVKINEPRLAQVFLSLLLNAVEAIPFGRPSSNSITVRTRTDDRGRAVIEISDTGVGIAPEHQARIMEPFFTTKPVGVGTGLGLSVARNIIGGFGGTMEIDSRLGLGTTVRVLLPPDAPAATQPDPTPPPAAPLKAPATEERARILVVDDDPGVAGVLRRLLKGHEVVIANGGVPALELLARDQDFDVVFCDLMMPDRSGREVYAEIERSAPELARRVVFISGGVFSTVDLEFLQKFGDRCIDKPFEPSTIRAVVARTRRPARA